MLSLRALLDYLETLEPGLLARLRGATPVAIAELEQAAERRLPEVQRELLMLMGEDDGGICAGFVGADMRAATLLGHFADSGWIPPAPFVLLGLDDQGVPMSSFLRCAPELDPPEFVQFAIPGGAQALVASGPDNYRLMAPSLATWLYRCGVTNFIGGRYAWTTTAEVLDAQPDHGARFDALLVERGLRRELGSDALTGAYWAREAALVWSRNSLEEPIFAAIYADDRLLLDELAALLATVTALRRYMVQPMQGTSLTPS